MSIRVILIKHTGITFDNLARNPDDYMDMKVKFRDKVFQVIEEEDNVHLVIEVRNQMKKFLKKHKLVKKKIQLKKSQQ